MKELPFLETYSGESLEELLQLEDRYRIDSLVLAIEMALQRKQQWTLTEQVVLAIEALEREVNNGGYDQFFFNSSRRFVAVIVHALQLIGCPQTAAITQKAIDALDITGCLTEEAVEHAIREDSMLRTEILSECNSAYYEGSEEPIAAKLFAYVKANKSDIQL